VAAEILTIPARYCGPPGVGNGGYVAGVLARGFDGAVSVKLRAPAPLDRPLQVERTESGAKLRDGATLVAEAVRTVLDIDVPAPPPYAAAERTLQQFRGYDKHIYPGCFVCGPKRAAGDGLRVFALRVPETVARLVAAWTPDAAFADARGELASEYLWGALDCPGGFAIDYAEGMAVVTGEIVARMERSVRVGEPCLVAAWPIASEGRRHRAGTAIFTAAGERVAVAQSTWFEVPRRAGA
jgi:hypothetical protein